MFRNIHLHLEEVPYEYLDYYFAKPDWWSFPFSSNNLNSTEREFVIISSRIELRCRKCNGMVRWWQEDTKKIRPFIRGGPDEECSAMR
jgi:hypothetical protein